MTEKKLRPALIDPEAAGKGHRKSNSKYNMMMDDKTKHFHSHHRSSMPDTTIVSDSMSVSKLGTNSNTELLQKVMVSLDQDQKAKLLQTVKKHNQMTKQLENQAVFKGTTKNLQFQSVEPTSLGKDKWQSTTKLGAHV